MPGSPLLSKRPQQKGNLYERPERGPGSRCRGLNVAAEILSTLRRERQLISSVLLQKVITASEVLADVLICAGVVFVVCLLYPSLHLGRETRYSISIVAGLVMVLLFHRDGAYRGGGSLLQIRATERALRIPAQSMLLLLAGSILFHVNVPWPAFLIALILLPLLLILEKQILFAIMRIDRAAESMSASAVDPIAPLHYAVAKRTADVIVSSLLLLLLAPVFFVIAVLVWLDSPGPIFFIQKRVGRNGQLFDMYKFRSMYATAPRYGLSPTQSSDRRITSVGRFLRRSSLDELPQLINVLLGNMSLVGPRPEMPFIVRRYNSRQRQRLRVIPGITGLWQLSADRAFPIHENIHYDLSYIQNRTFFMDLAILIHTPLRALRGGI
jgi:lipopolysaccharide/colanic/teichoic acid biosynthesis glycosyltransferase